MIGKSSAIGLILAALLWATPCHTADLKDLNEIIPGMMAEHAVPGLAIAIVKDDSVVFLQGFGLANIEDSVAVDPEKTLFRIASVAKLFTATLAVDLASKGTLELDRDVEDYLPSIRIDSRFSEPITLHRLLTHTAGFDERVIGYAATSRDDIRPLGAYLSENLPRRGRRPGEMTAYSNHGMALAAYTIERTVGESFANYARDSLFLKLGMTHTSYLDPASDSSHFLAHGYRCNDSNCTRLDEIYSHPYPAGLAYSTAADMAKFITMQLGRGKVGDDRLFLAAAITSMQQMHFTHDSLLPGMSYGFFNQNERGWRALSHAGGVPGKRSLLMIVPDVGVGFFFATNGGTSSFGATLKNTIIARLIEDSSPPRSAPGTSFSNDHLQSFEGTYQLTRNAHFTVEKLPALFALSHYVTVTGRGTIRLSIAGGIELEPLDSLRFREVGGDRIVAFEKDAANRVVRMFAPLPFFGADFPAAFERRSWFDTPYIKNEYMSYLVGVPIILIFLLWPVLSLGAWWRSRSKPKSGKRVRREAIVALVVAALFSALFTLFGFGFIARSIRMIESSTGIVMGMTPQMFWLLQLPYALAVLATIQVAFAVNSWRRGYWGLIRRIVYSLLTLVSLLVIAFLVRWNYLPPVW